VGKGDRIGGKEGRKEEEEKGGRGEGGRGKKRQACLPVSFGHRPLSWLQISEHP
jgi:hypothetical protein